MTCVKERDVESEGKLSRENVKGKEEKRCHIRRRKRLTLSEGSARGDGRVKRRSNKVQNE